MKMKNRPSDVEHILIRYATKEDYLRRMISDVESQWLFDPKHKSILKSNHCLDLHGAEVWYRCDHELLKVPVRSSSWDNNYR